MSSDRLTRALAEIQAVLEEQRHEREDAVRQVAELEVSLDAARSQASERERSLIEANSRLLSQVEELSTTVARMQAQIVDLTRSANTALVSRNGGSSTASSQATHTNSHMATPFTSRASSLPTLPASTRHEYIGDLGRGEGFEDASRGLMRSRLGGEGSSSASAAASAAAAAAAADDLDAMRMSPTGGVAALPSQLPRPGSSSAAAAAPTRKSASLNTSSISSSPSAAAAASHAAAAASSVALHVAVADLGGGWGSAGGGSSRPDMGAGSYDLQPAAAAAPASGASAGAAGAGRASAAAAAAAGSSSSSSEQGSGATTGTTMTTPAFFSLLTRSVAPSNLETLMHALSVFNQGKIGKQDLLGIAEQTLKVAPGTAGADSLPDLVAVFKRLVLRMT